MPTSIPLQTQTDIDLVVAFLVWPFAGAALGTVSYLKNNDTAFRRDQFIKTVVVYTAGAVAAYFMGEEFSEEAIIAGVALAAPVVNTLLDGWLPGGKGGSPTSGFRFGESRGR